MTTQNTQLRSVLFFHEHCHPLACVLARNGSKTAAWVLIHFQKLMEQYMSVLTHKYTQVALAYLWCDILRWAIAPNVPLNIRLCL